MNRIVWSPQAIDDLESLRAYIGRDSPSAANRVALKIVNTVETLLPGNPEIGRQGRVAGTRELVISGTPFIVPYRADLDAIQILRVYHGARKWPDHF
jgi:toxin ParE1/3/4